MRFGGDVSGIDSADIDPADTTGHALQSSLRIR
jgi:hypothetical protein